MKSRIILASAIPRRQELLTQIDLPFEVCPSEWEEVTDKELPEEVVQELSYHKAMEVYERNVTEEGTVVIGADTIVACGGQILGKPVPGNGQRRCWVSCRAARTRSIPELPLCGKEKGGRKPPAFMNAQTCGFIL